MRLNRPPLQVVIPSIGALALCSLANPSRLVAQGRVPRLEPSECPFERPDWTREVRLECHWLVVPEVRDKPNGRTVRLAVAIVRAATPTATPLVMLHGGPGGSGLRTYLPAARGDGVLARNRDLVIYDQRGSGYSEPKLCPNYGAVEDSALRLRTREQREKLWDDNDRACVASLRKQGIDPAAYNTSASAADLIDLRKTLGYQIWDVYGGSYGARLAQEAMRQDPKGIRSVALASPVTRGPTREAEVGLSIQRALDRVWSACAAQPSCNTAFPTVGADFFAVFDELTKSPLPVTLARDGRGADTIWLDGERLLAAIRDNVISRPGRLARLPLLLHELRRGDKMRAAQTLVGYDTGGGTSNQQVLVHLVNCYDSYGPAFRAAQDSVNAVVPPAFRRDQLSECPTWQTRFADPAEHAPIRSDIPTLILTGVFDDRTPTEHARRIAATLTHAYLYEFPNEGHGARPAGCHLSILAQFFNDPFHAPDATCIAAIPRVRFITRWDETG